MIGNQFRLLPNLAVLLGVLIERQHPAADGIPSSVVTADDEQHQIAKILHGVHVFGGFAVRQHRHQIALEQAWAMAAGEAEDAGQGQGEPVVTSQLSRAPARLPEDVRQVLTKLDARLLELLRNGDVRLVRTAWFLKQPQGYLMEFRQQLEEREEVDKEQPSPLLSPDEAVDLMDENNAIADAFATPLAVPGALDEVRCLCSLAHMDIALTRVLMAG